MIVSIKPFLTTNIQKPEFKQQQFRTVNFAISQDVVKFGGLSRKEDYSSPLVYKAALILEQKFAKITGNKNPLLTDAPVSKSKLYSKGDLSKTNFKDGNLNVDWKQFFNAFTCAADAKKINWKINYYDDETKKDTVKLVNDARISVLTKWRDLLLVPEEIISQDASENLQALKEELQSNFALKIIIWDGVNNLLANNNRHIPEPLDLEVLAKTVKEYKQEDGSFISVYSNNLRNDVVNKMLTNPNLQKNVFKTEKGLWVKIPSKKHDRENFNYNVFNIEVLSHRGWCTKSSIDKAKAALEDGNFYMYLEKDINNVWQPCIAMTSSEGKIAQIQGRENNNVIPEQYIEIVEKFIEDRDLDTLSGYSSEGPNARLQILISKKLKEKNPKTGISLQESIAQNDVLSILQHFNGLLTTKKGAPLKLNLDPTKGIVVPLRVFGIKEERFWNDLKALTNSDNNIRITIQEEDSNSEFWKTLKRKWMQLLGKDN